MLKQRLNVSVHYSSALDLESPSQLLLGLHNALH